MAEARERLRTARAAVAADSFSAATSLAYYAMLYAARAALSEEDRNAKTHTGTWNLFGETFVATERFDRELLGRARKAQRIREAADYDARTVSRQEAAELVEVAEAFVAAVERLVAE